MRAILIVSLMCLSGCIGYVRGDGQGNVEVVTNLGRSGDLSQDTEPPDETEE